jgi:NDP-sugar pyrophosphorylase family protein
MDVSDIKEKANEVREERASSLKGFFNNCFVPTKSNEEKNQNIKDDSASNTNQSGNTTYSENATHSENDIYIGNTIYSENAIYSENNMRSVNDIHIGNATYSENDTLENATCSENDTLENAIYSENDTRENATYSENTTRENAICSENDTHNGTTVKLVRRLGFTALGVLAVLIDEFPAGSGMLNVTQLSKSCGVARTTLITQLRTLEKCGAVSLGYAEKSGRWLEILCSGNATCSENTTHPSCSSSSSILNNNNNNYNYYRDPVTYIGNTTCSENTTLEPQTYIGNAIHSENDISFENATYSENNTHIENDTYIENATYSETTTLVEKLSKSKITVRIAARELFFVVKASLVDMDRLSKQCFEQFLAVKHAKGANYAMALFLCLLSKSKENPTAYVIRAIQQGAAPSREDQRRAEIISKAGETVFKKIGEEILQRDLDFALSQIALEGVSQSQIHEELDIFTKRISD